MASSCWAAGRELSDPPPHDVVDGRRDADQRCRPAGTGCGQGDDLADEERVAARTVVHLARDGRPVGPGGDPLLDVVHAETTEVDAHRPSRELRDAGQRRRAKISAAHRDDEQQHGRRAVGQQLEHAERAGVGPLQIVDDDAEGLPGLVQRLGDGAANGHGILGRGQVDRFGHTEVDQLAGDG